MVLCNCIYQVFIVSVYMLMFTVACAHATSLLSLLPLKGRQLINGFQRVNMSSPSTSYSETDTSILGHSSSDESEVKGEPSKQPEPKVVSREAPRNTWAPKGDVPVTTVTPRIVAPMLPVGAASQHPKVVKTARPATPSPPKSCKNCPARHFSHLGGANGAPPQAIFSALLMGCK